MIGTYSTGTVTIQLVSALEDHLPGFSANWAASSTSGDYPMDRQTDDNTYAGVIGPKISSKETRCSFSQMIKANSWFWFE